jgi:inward rectifier potassium channel
VPQTNEATESLPRDLGLGDRVAQRHEGRFIRRDGTFNVRRIGLSPFRSLSLYHQLLTISWPRFFMSVAGFYLVSNLAFACAYVWAGPGALSGTTATTPGGRFLEAFFFSVHTLATIGYGTMSPHRLSAHLLVTVEALFGLMGLALVTGILFARFSRPDARIVFSHQAVIAPHKGGWALMFRIANARTNQLLEVSATVTLNRLEGGRRRYYELPLERRKIMFFPLHWVIVHAIDETSPLANVTHEQFLASDAEILVLLSAVEEDFGQNVHARFSYLANEVFWGARFANMYVDTDDGTVAVDMRQLHRIEAVPDPPA